MRPFVYILLTLVVMAGVFGSCRHTPGEAEERLIAIDSLIAIEPDSALAQLEAINADSLPADLQAYHDLLVTQAMYKAYVPASTDTLITRAWRYYADHGPYDRRIRAMLYRGTVAEELGYPDSAMRWYKRTEQSANANDYSIKGYALLSMASLYQQQPYCNDLAIEKYKLALAQFKAKNDSVSILACYGELGATFRTINTDSAIFYLNRAIYFASLLSDSSSYYYAINSMIGLYYYNEQYRLCKESSLNLIKNGIGFTDSTCFYYAAISYAKLGEPDSAKILLSKTRKPQNLRDSLLFYMAVEEIDDDMAFSNKKNLPQSEILTDSAMRCSPKTVLAQSEMGSTIDELNKTNHKKSSQLKQLGQAALLALLVIAIMGWKIYKHRQNNKKLDTLAQNSKQSLDSMIKRIKNQEIVNERMVIAYNLQTQIFKKVFVVISNSERKERVSAVRKLLTPKFFKNVYEFLNIRYNNLANRLLNSNLITEKEANIICLHLCELPNFITMCYMNITSEHSVTTKKKHIIKKLLGKNVNIDDFLQFIDAK